MQETGRRLVAGHPELYVVSNVVENGVPIGSLGAGESVWHTDMSYIDAPPNASMLYALEVPSVGGNTYFSNMYRAYDLLTPSLKARVAGLRLKHDGTYNSGGYARQGVEALDDPIRAAGVVHPLVCTHPETGRKALYLGRRRNAYLVGLARAESDALLDEIWSYATGEELSWRHRWQVGDVVRGTIAAPCTGAMPLTTRRAASCTAPRSRAKPGRRPEHRPLVLTVHAAALPRKW